MTYAKHIKFVMSVCILIALPFVIGCSKHTIPVPSSKLSRMPIHKTVPQQATVPELINQARILSDQGVVQDALLLYNHAFNLTQRPGAGHDAVFKTIILDDIEKNLSKIEPEEIQKFSRIKHLSIPQDIFDYWAGYTFAQREDFTNAANVLNAFLEKYPDHPKTEQVKELLAGMGTMAFNKKKIGVILPMSGKYKLYGQQAMKGIELALARLSESGIKDLSIEVKDSMSDSAQAAKCVDQLGKNNVFSILGPILVSRQAADKAQALGIPMMALTQKIQFPQYGDYIFSNFITPEMQVQALGSYVFHELGLRRMAVLYPDDKYGNRYMQAFGQMVEQFDGQLTATQVYDGSKTDFSDSIKKLIRDTGLNFQALFIPDSVSRINLILPQLVYHDAKHFTLLGTNLWHRDSLLKETRRYNSNAIICDGYFSGSANPATARFDKTFQDLYQERPGFLEAIAYDTTQILFTAANADDVNSGKQLKAVLQGQFIFDGATGRTRFDETGTPHKALFLITIKDNQFMEINR
ncbi:penicillin-binding protein activator [Desulfobacter hydrogenophilus]|uniref:Penicillin-binding protein activator n=2 Tax=Desulfobacter hydrogenophilus TaxID=2291 RepID=A0A328FHC1_9BACT|nr:ABC transporter substrate-binding protein [Desulfobacter hydrogenophilus]QBH15416.1 penicillin-binding protein activator [Desulfobacter hydrogenophilus]RAM02493.1 penicillin-binding protein activator [Desulfobacter hydrogenophilus]